MKDFEALYRKHVDSVFRFALHCSGRRDVAEDITSEAFLALYQNFDRIDEERLPAWLFTVAKNRAIDYWRHAGHEERYEGPSNPRAGKAPWAAHELFLNPALKQVHRVCLILRYIYGMDRAEIANQTGLSEMQIKGHLQYGLQLLRKELHRSSRKEAT